MRPDMRAVLFDLDDTLYPYRRFQLSGFAAVARYLQTHAGLDARLGFRALHRASTGATKGREIQACLAQYDLPSAWAADLVDILRYHEPTLRLPLAIARALATLTDEGWKVGVLTNGRPSIQARKIEALELRPYVDAVVYAANCGRGEGKPDPEAFAEICRQLGVATTAAVFVGNDERTDIAGALDVGMRAVRAELWTPPSGPTRADAVVRRAADLSGIVRRFAQEVVARHAA